MIALTYGTETDWVRNVLAGGGCDLVRGGKTLALAGPHLIETADPPADLPAPVRRALRLLTVAAYLRLAAGEETPARRP